MSFDTFAILNGDLLPTNTGAVESNVPGLLGEYRNGALMIQALDASEVSGGFVLNAATEEFVAPSAAVHATLGYATKGLLWESTVFWHWNGPDYGQAGHAELFDSCVIQGLGGCARLEDDDGDGSGGSTPPTVGGGDPPPPLPVPSDPGHTVTNTTVGGGTEDTGRLFWRELIPEE